MTSQPALGALPAILGGAPAFTEAKHVGMPNLPDRAVLHARLDEMLDSRRLTNDGPFVRRFEAHLAGMTGAAHAVAMCNGTLALQLLLRALGLAGEVVMPSFTFIATSHAATWEGLHPVFADVDPRSHTLDPDRAAAAITPRTAAIVGVHLWGGTCDADALQQVADRAGIPLLFDAAHALGCTHRGRGIGSLGRASVLSFHATKIAHSLEGGAVLTSDGELAERLRRLRNFGFIDQQVGGLGTNAKLDEMSAVFGLGCLEEFPALVETNRRNQEHYQRCLAGLPGFALRIPDRNERTNGQYVVVQVDPSASPLSRDEVVTALHAENLLARRHFSPGCHRLPPMRGRTDRTCRSPTACPGRSWSCPPDGR